MTADRAKEVYQFVFRGLLAEEALDRAGRKTRNAAGFADEEIAKALSISLLDDDAVSAAKRMSVVYTAIAAFEISVRQLITGALSEHFGESWWTTAASEKIRERAESRMAEEEKIRWHTQRGDDPITYTSLPDLINIIRNNWPIFEPYIQRLEWAANVFDVIERSRNVIMHSGVLEPEDIERIGINIRDWIKQVGS